jgi:hypothetical protein
LTAKTFPRKRQIQNWNHFINDKFVTLHQQVSFLFLRRLCANPTTTARGGGSPFQEAETKQRHSVAVLGALFLEYYHFDSCIAIQIRITSKRKGGGCGGE